MIARSGGVIVAVRGARPRAVPVLARYHEPLLAAAAFAGAGLVTGGAETGRTNLTARLNSALAGGDGLPRLDTSRLRATWLRDAADLLGLATFLHAAGINPHLDQAQGSVAGSRMMRTPAAASPARSA